MIFNFRYIEEIREQERIKAQERRVKAYQESLQREAVLSSCVLLIIHLAKMVLQELAAEKQKKAEAEFLRQKWKQRVEKLGVHLKLRMLFHYFTSTCIE